MSSSQLRPLGQFIAVRPQPYKPASPIEVIEFNENLMSGEVLAVGPGQRLKKNKRRPMSVKPGERVIFRLRSARAWHDPKLSREVMLIEEDDVLGIEPPPTLKIGHQIDVRLAGDDQWYSGQVIDVHKMWVELQNYDWPMIADENNIVEWRWPPEIA